MTNNFQLLLTSGILVLLPLVPAIVIFKAFPRKENFASGEGELYGMRWKFGGAFAAYLAVALLLLYANKAGFQTRDAEVWTVRGAVSAGNLSDIPNLLSVRSLPHTLSVESDGSYEFKVIVNRSGDELKFPRVLFDLRSACRGSRSITLDGESSAGTFKALKAEHKIDIKRNESDRSIELSPIVLELHPDGTCNG